MNNRNASSAQDLTETSINDTKRRSSASDAKTIIKIKTSTTTTPTPTAPTKLPKPIKTPIKFDDELKVITQNNAPAKKNTFGHIFKNFFK